MSKEPRSVGNPIVSNPTSSNTNNNTSSANNRLTPQNFHTFDSRVKALPPSADTSKVPATTSLYQFRQLLSFRCANCRLDNIQDDGVAIDAQSGRMTCQKCFARIIRPRNYKPTRLVPFPSLLSWLNFNGGSTSAAGTSSSNNKLEQDGAPLSVDAFSSQQKRMAEAVIPSEARARPMGMMNGDNNNHNNIAGLLLPATPVAGLQQTAAATLASMNNNGNNNNNYANGAQYVPQQNQNQNQQHQGSISQSNISSQPHPCASVFGLPTCTHGATCFFFRAPGNVCLAFLMGLCDDANKKCNGRQHQRVFDLPSNSVAATRPARWEIVSVANQNNKTQQDGSVIVADEEDHDDETTLLVAQETEAFRKWVDEKKNSRNQPEWQLWNHSSVGKVVDEYLPAPVVQQPEKKKLISQQQDQQQTETKKFGGLSASSIESMLRAMKK